MQEKLEVEQKKKDVWDAEAAGRKAIHEEQKQHKATLCYEETRRREGEADNGIGSD
jgi:hypothetical protein